MAFLMLPCNSKVVVVKSQKIRLARIERILFHLIDVYSWQCVEFIENCNTILDKAIFINF